MPRLLEVADLCSSTVSGTANRLLKRTDSEGSSSAAEKKSSAVPLISQRSHVGNLRQTLQGKGVKIRGWKPQVSTLLCARAASAHSPLRFSEKLPARQGRTRSRSSHPPLSRCRKEAAQIGRTRPRGFVFPAPPAPINKRKKGTRTGAFSIVVRSCDGGGTSYGRSPTDR